MATSVPHDDHNALPVGLRLGEFEIRRVLGSGGFGIVYVAFDRALEREVAIKEYMPASLAGRSATHHVTVLSRSNAETFALGLRSFVNEAKLLARFDHPSLVKVLRFWEEQGTAYMAMPYYKGSTLKALRQGMNATPDEAWLRKVCEALLGALEAMHKEGVFHRDISPDNIVVDEDGRPVLLDFGAARRVINDKSQALTAILKPNYAPIEQYAESPGLRQGPWTDIYALGATLHFLVTGQPPMPATARALNDQRMPLQHQSIERLSKPLLALIDWMLAPRPESRPRDVQQVRAALAGRLDVPAAPMPTPPAADDDNGWPQTQVFERTLPPAAAGPTAAADPHDDAEDDPDATIVRPAHWRPAALAKAPPAAPSSPAALVAASQGLASQVPVSPVLAAQVPEALDPVSQTPAQAPDAVRPPEPPAVPLAAGAAAAAMPSRPARSPLPWLLGGGALVAAVAVYLFAGNRPEPAPVPPSAAASSPVVAAASAASVGTEAVTVIGAVPAAPAASAVAQLPVVPPSAPGEASTLPAVAPAPVLAASAPAVSAAQARAAAASAAQAARLARAAAAASKPQAGGARTPGAASAVAMATPLPTPAPSAAALPQPAARTVVVAAPVAAAEPERRDPNDACSGKMLVALHRCLIRECVKPEFAQHPACVRAREVERRTLDSMGNN